MKVGDLVSWWPKSRSENTPTKVQGVIVGFNKKGEGGQDFVHVLHDGSIVVLMCFDVEVINESS
tara:strand:- start:302 stop:493 length:192 start_codon:yes stop_codon:yes gene_type:complete